ncbi:MAG: hypothetical protein Q4G23_01740 [Clostridia bacterium]|nr:hypothetical protein [Clostridia bacterium]
MTKIINFSMGLFSGALLGMAVFALTDPIDKKHKKCIRKKGNRICKSIEHTLDSVADMF